MLILSATKVAISSSENVLKMYTVVLAIKSYYLFSLFHCLFTSSMCSLIYLRSDYGHISNKRVFKLACFPEFKEQLFLKTSDTASSWLHTCMLSLCFSELLLTHSSPGSHYS